MREAGAAAASKTGAVRTLTRLIARYKDLPDIYIYRDGFLRARRRADTATAKNPSPIMVQVAGSGIRVVPGGVDPGGFDGGENGGVSGGKPGGDPGGVGVDDPPGPGKLVGEKGVRKVGVKIGTTGVVWMSGSGARMGATASGGMSRIAVGVSGRGLTTSGGMSTEKGRSRMVDSTRSCGPNFDLMRWEALARAPGERCANSARGSFSDAIIFSPNTWLKARPPGSVTTAKVKPKNNGASNNVRFGGTPANKPRNDSRLK